MSEFQNELDRIASLPDRKKKGWMATIAGKSVYLSKLKCSRGTYLLLSPCRPRALNSPHYYMEHSSATKLKCREYVTNSETVNI